MQRQEPSGPLHGLTVLEISGEAGHYCGKLFADLGADVVLVEPPGGDPLRRRPPLYTADGVPPVSIPFSYLNTGKRALTLDLDNASGQAEFRRLAQSADLVISTGVGDLMAGRGLSYGELGAANSRLVMVSITPFGLTGPLANCVAPDLVCLAMGGLLALGGYADGAPMRPPESQAYAAGAAFGAVGAMIALHHAQRTGEGQLVDVSIQQCVTMGLENSVQFYDLEGTIRRRTGGEQKAAGTGLFPTADGSVFILAAGIGGHRFWGNLLRWLRDEGVAEADLLDGPQWAERGFLAGDEAKQTFARVFGGYVAGLAKQTVYELSQKYRVPCAPVNTLSDVVRSPQLDHRGYFRDIELAPGHAYPAPGAPYRLSRTPVGDELVRPGRPGTGDDA
ncbi:succinyl-CoA--D-citramalate CoA-transferase [Acrocarpospora pleiomorpha]|uniref:Succinyl-CoA--D-citramalate CoA-transferase n=1 Tax=Acrocarpospora pleiomorpha TaxID=90975 RepID=A0A5M3XGL8_9ACTN|nr:CoA transferase [Acrocarpospora pleiomorpha]GES20695.1 succinyl-CoA--D-citramalate CoA-transferase [Acrocarpospora pleiomorpha]